MNCKTLCGDKCHSRLHGLIHGHLNSVNCRRRKLHYGKLDTERFFRGELTVQIHPVDKGGIAIPYNGHLYVNVIDDGRSAVVKALREKIASLFEFLS